MTLYSDLDIPAQISLVITGSKMEDLTIQALLMYNPGDDRYTNAKIDFSNPLSPVTSTSIKKVAIHRTLVEAAREHLGQLPANEKAAEQAPAIKTYFRGTVGRKISAKVAADPSDQILDQAAAIYRTARAIGDTPVISIRRCFNISYPQAKRWARILRRKELI